MQKKEEEIKLKFFFFFFLSLLSLGETETVFLAKLHLQHFWINQMTIGFFVKGLSGQQTLDLLWWTESYWLLTKRKSGKKSQWIKKSHGTKKSQWIKKSQWAKKSQVIWAIFLSHCDPTSKWIWKRGVGKSFFEAFK